MKGFPSIALMGAALLFPRAIDAQSYGINWHTIAGGGGTSTGASGANSYTVSGTIGQAATATMSGGSYSVTGGFWSIIAAVQTPGAPLLNVTRSGSSAVISWSATAAGFVLEQSANLMQGSWTPSGATLVTNNGVVSVTVGATGGYQYFRLHNP